MAFKKMDTNKLPPRHWLLLGYPGVGKSTFAAQMAAPLLLIDADHRFTEVAGLASGDVFDLSDNPADHMDAERIADLLKDNMAGSGVKTIVVDSLTSIITPITTKAVMDNDAGRNRNRVASFKDKALTMRLLQDTITGYGIDVLWIAHLRTSMNSKVEEIESSTITAVELARLRRCLNIEMRVVTADDGTHGIKIDWARKGYDGVTIWDETGCWRGMPEKIEAAVYGGLTKEQMDAKEKATPTKFATPESAIAWGFEQGVFRDAVHAKNAYDKLKEEKKPKTASLMWTLWIADVNRRKESGVIEEDQPVEEPVAEAPIQVLVTEVPAAVVAEIVQVAEPVIPEDMQPEVEDTIPSLWNTLSDLYGDSLDPNSRKLMAAYAVRKYTLQATPNSVRDSEDLLTDQELAALQAGLIKNSAKHLTAFLKTIKKEVEAA